MINLNATELHDLAVVVATAFPVLVVAYYSAARGLIDDILRDEGPEWMVEMPTPRWTHWWLMRFLIQAVGNTRFKENKPDVFIMNERFRLASDVTFMVVFPIGFLLSLVHFIIGWRWALAGSVLLLQIAIDSLMVFGTQVSMVHLASAIAKHPRGVPPARTYWFNRQPGPLDTRPLSALMTVIAMSIVLFLAALYIAIAIQWFPAR
jgi:hypothetical protein